MDSLTWQKGKNLKGFIEHGTGGQIDLEQLAVAMIVAAQEQGVTLEEIVQHLILANDFNGAVSKQDRATWLHQLGF